MILVFSERSDIFYERLEIFTVHSAVFDELSDISY